MQSTTHKVLKRIKGKGRGSVHTPKDFLDLGSRASVDQALSRLAKKGEIRRVRRGVYDYPRQNDRLGVLSPSADAVAKAVAGITKLQVSGARAANELGLSTQVPAKHVYLTAGTRRHLTFGNQTVWLRHAAPRHLLGAGETTGLVFQALRYLGKDRVDDGVVATLCHKLSPDDKRALRKSVVEMPTWMHDAARRISADAC